MILALLSLAGLGFASLTAATVLVRSRSLVTLVLSASLIAYVSLLTLGLALSTVGEFDRRGWLVGVAVLTAAAAATLLTGRARLGIEGLTSARAVLIRGLHDPLIGAMLVVAISALSYELALALLTPAAEGDALAYHLTRAAFWLQNHGIVAVDGSRDPRIDESPLGAEIGVAFTMAVQGGTQLVGLAQWCSVIVATVAVFGIARRLGTSRRPAALAAMCVPALPIVALQAPTALNDVVVGALVALTVYFLLDPQPAGTILAFVGAAALAATKVTSVIAVVVLVAVAAAAGTGRRRWWRIGAVVTGALVGWSWLLVAPAGDTELGRGARRIGGASTGLHSETSLLEAFGRATRHLLALFELPGAAGRDALLYTVAGAVLALAAAAQQGSARHTTLIAAAFVAATPLLLPIGAAAGRVYRKSWFELGRPDIGSLGVSREVTAAGATYSWFGAVGLAVVVTGVSLVIAGGWWRTQRLAALLALAPLLSIAGMSVAVGYSEYEGRYTIGGFLVGLAAVATVLSDRRAALWTIAVSAVTLVLVFDHAVERPAGIRLLDAGPRPTSVWTRSAAAAQGPVRGMAEAIRFTDANIPRDARVAIWATPSPDRPAPSPIVLWPYPFFGAQLTRRVDLVRSLDDATRLESDWALLPRYLVRGCHEGWRRETASYADFQAFRRDTTASCPPRRTNSPSA